MTGCSCMSGGKRRRTRRTRRRRSRRSKRKTNKHHRRRSSRHRRSRRSKRTRRRRGGLRCQAAYMGVGTGNPTRLQTGGNSLAASDYKISGGYKKKKRGGTSTKTSLAHSGGLY